MRKLLFFGLVLVLLAPVVASAASITPLSWSDEGYLSSQRARVDELTRMNLGTPVRGNLSDLETLQRIIDRELVPRDDTLTQQAMGVVLGDALIEEESELEWKVYEDELGRTRALCVVAGECLFPVTMLSRRMAVGLKPDVNKIFRNALELIEPHLPKLPYGGERKRSFD